MLQYQGVKHIPKLNKIAFFVFFETNKKLKNTLNFVIDTSKHMVKKNYIQCILLSKTTINLFIRTLEYVKNIYCLQCAYIYDLEL